MQLFKNSKWFSLFLGLLIGLLLMLIAGTLFLRNNYIQTFECAHNFQYSVELLKKQVKQNPQWILRRVACTLPATVDSQQIAMFNLCSTKYANALLNNPKTRQASALIPCQISLYEKEGKCYLSRTNIGLIGILLGGDFQSIFTFLINPEQELILLPLRQ